MFAAITFTEATNLSASAAVTILPDLPFRYGTPHAIPPGKRAREVVHSAAGRRDVRTEACRFHRSFETPAHPMQSKTSANYITSDPAPNERCLGKARQFYRPAAHPASARRVRHSGPTRRSFRPPSRNPGARGRTVPVPHRAHRPLGLVHERIQNSLLGRYNLPCPCYEAHFA